MSEEICKECFIDKILSNEGKEKYNSGRLEIVESSLPTMCDLCGRFRPIVAYSIENETTKEYVPQINEEYCDYKGSKDVLFFIKQFLSHNNNVESETVLKDQFNAGYCYYFAVILKAAFNRGEVCWCAPYGHMCWMDDDGTPYDIYGLCISEADHFIPVSYLGECLNDFLHINKVHCTTEEEIQDIINRYLNDKKEKTMRHVMSEKIHTPEEYLKLVTGEDCTLPVTKNQIEAIEVFLEEKGYCLWSHALTEIEHISNGNFDMGVVLVDCLIYNEETKENEHCYRWFEVEELDIEDVDENIEERFITIHNK